MESILTSVKAMLGILEDITAFDTELIMHINAVLFTLTQLNVGKLGFYITDDSQEWSEFITDDNILEAAKSLVYLKVKVLFDPPQSSIVAEATNRMISEFESRLLYEADMEGVNE